MEPDSSRCTYEDLATAWERMKQPQPERPFVVSPVMYAELERRGVITNGVVDVAALRREAGL